VLIPEENEKDLEEIPKNIREGLEIIPVKHVDEVLRLALTEPLTSIDWTDADELAAQPPVGVPGIGESVHKH
jgi:ATP-dependent Lon protease